MKRILFSLLALGSVVALSAAPVSYIVTVDTSSIAASTPGFIEFQFNRADALTSLAALAYVDNFTSTGFTFDSTSDAILGGVTGSPSSPPLVFDNTVGGANIFDRGVSSFGGGFRFVLTLDGAALSTAANDGSEFFVFVLASDYNPLLGSGSTGAVASVAINGDMTITTNPVDALSTIGPVPEPSTLILCGLAGIGLISRRFRR